MAKITTQKTPTEKVRGSRAHTRYYNAAHVLVPSVTTIIDDTTPKNHLIAWANRLGLQGIDSTRYVDALSVVGSLTHYLIECHLSKVDPVLEDYTPNELTMAGWALAKYLEWEQSVNFTPILSEKRLVSEAHQFGGTIDAYGQVGKWGSENASRALVDFKTSARIYPTHKLQVGGGYSLLLAEHAFPVEEVWILQIGRDATENFSAHRITDIDRLQREFLACRALYAIRHEKGVTE